MRTACWSCLLLLIAANLWLLAILGLLSCVSSLVPSWIGFASAPMLFVCGRMFMQLVLDPPSCWPRNI